MNTARRRTGCSTPPTSRGANCPTIPSAPLSIDRWSGMAQRSSSSTRRSSNRPAGATGRPIPERPDTKTAPGPSCRPPTRLAPARRWSDRHRLIAPVLGCADGGETNGYGRCIPYGAVFDTTANEWGDLPNAPGKDRKGVSSYGGVSGTDLVAGSTRGRQRPCSPTRTSGHPDAHELDNSIILPSSVFRHPRPTRQRPKRSPTAHEYMC